MNGDVNHDDFDESFNSNIDKADTEKAVKKVTLNEALNTAKEEEKKKKKKAALVVPPSSLFIFAYSNLFRRFCQWLTGQKFFDYFIIGAIIANCGVMALDVRFPNSDQNPLSSALVSTKYKASEMMKYSTESPGWCVYGHFHV